MFTDMVGYSKLMSADEALTMELLEEHDQVLEPIILSQSGRIIKHEGDAIFAEFTSSLSAVKAAIQIQSQLKKRNRYETAKRQFQIRIGIHVGDVLVKDDDLFGDGVNLAARIEPIAPLGGIAVTGAVYNSIRGDREIYTRKMGLVKLKNIKDPARVYKVYLDKLNWNSETELELHKSLVERGIPLVDSDRPLEKEVNSIAVLYFHNLGDDKDEFFCYGIVEDLIMDLIKAGPMRIPLMKDVIKYRDSELSTIEIGKELKVNQALEGNIWRIGDVFRLSVRLLEVQSGVTLWAERWEEPVQNASAIKGRIAVNILQALAIALPKSLQTAIVKKTTDDARAYEFYLRGVYLIEILRSNEDLLIAQDLFKQAFQRDPGFTKAYYYYAMSFQKGGNYEEALNQLVLAEEVAQSSLDHSGLAKVNNGFGIVYMHWGKYERAISYLEKALNIATDLEEEHEEAQVLNNLGMCYNNLKDFNNQIKYLHRSLAIKEKLGDEKGIAASLGNLGLAHKNAGDYARALNTTQKALEKFQQLDMLHFEGRCLMNLAEIYQILGQDEECLRTLEKSYTISQQFNDTPTIGKIFLIKARVFLNQEKYDQAFEYLRRAIGENQSVDYRPGIETASIYLSMGLLDADLAAEAKDSIGNTVKLLSRSRDQLNSNLGQALHFVLQAKLNQFDRDKALRFLEVVDDLDRSAEYRIVLILWHLCQAFKMDGDLSTAEKCHQKAREYLLDMADLISDPQLQTDYLSKIRYHQYILNCSY